MAASSYKSEIDIKNENKKAEERTKQHELKDVHALVKVRWEPKAKSVSVLK